MLIVVGGFVLLLGGLAIGWLPGPGGFISVFGAALLATEFRPLARLLDWTEVQARRGWRWAASFWNRSSLSVKVLTLVATAAVAAGAAYLAGSLLLD